MAVSTAVITPRFRWAVLVGALAVVATLAALVWVRSGDTAAPAARSVPGAGQAPAAPSRILPATAPHADAGYLAHDFVAAAPPTRFTLAGKDFTINAQVCAMAPVFPLDPPGEQHHTVCWVTKGFGVAPGSNTGTSFVLGHSWAPDPQEVLNQASSRATRDILRVKQTTMDGVPVYPATSMLGLRLTLRTARGTLVYSVRDAFGVRKNQLGYVSSALDPNVRNRIVLITCAELGGVDYDYNVVLDARLVSSVAPDLHEHSRGA